MIGTPCRLPLFFRYGITTEKDACGSLHPSMMSLKKTVVLKGEIDRIRKQQPDSELSGEYIRLLRLVRVAHTIKNGQESSCRQTRFP